MLGKKVFGLLAVVSLVLAVAAPVALAAEPLPAAPQADPKMQPYADALAYWFQSVGDKDWQTRVTEALTPAPDQLVGTKVDEKNADPAVTRPQFPEAERVYLTGVPATAWWIDVWRLELDGQWTKVPAIHPAGQAPSPVSADLSTQGKLPGVYVIRVVDKSGSVLLDAPRMLVESWTAGHGGTWQQTFDVPSLPKALASQLSQITM
jgi:hypothetical protein